MTITLEQIPDLTYDQLLENIRLSEDYTALHKALKKELQNREPTNNYKCFKCGHTKFEEHQARVAQSFGDTIVNLASARYRAVVCARCKFTEFYQGNVGVGQQVIDVFLS